MKIMMHPDTKLDWMIAESVLQLHSPEEISRR